MEFAYEHQLVIPATDWLKKQGFEIKREFPTPWGICDLVGCSFNKRNVKKRLSRGQKKPIGNQLQVTILSMIPDVEKERGGITDYDLHSRFSNLIDPSKINREIDKLITNKFIQKTNSGELQRLNGWIPLHKKMVALELKLSRIEDVLHQAICNLEFADESYAGFPLEVAAKLIRSKKKTEFVNNGIGILGITANSCKLFLKSRPNKLQSNLILQMYCAERFWRSYSKNNLA